ncbi:MAG: tetratricopeptide repeat protein [Deltaproteobacteria bacterium]|nr:tetratricopeptide repeat protein [Deltaproteobacteria bacterium]
MSKPTAKKYRRRSQPVLNMALGLGLATSLVTVAAGAEPPKPAQKAPEPTEAERLVEADKLASPGKNAEARAIYADVAKKNIKSLAAWRGLAKVSGALGKQADVLKALESVAGLDPKDRDSRLVLGRAAYEKRKLGEAARRLSEAHALGALTEYSDLLALGTALDKTGDAKAALTQLSAAAATPEGAKSTALLLDLARRAAKANDKPAAKARYERVFANDPKNTEAATVLLADALAGADREKARPYLELLAASGTKDAKVYVTLGELADAKKDHAGAAAQYAKAQKAAPADPAIALALGRALVRQGNRKAATPELEKAWRGKAALTGQDLETLLEGQLEAKQSGLETARALLQKEPDDMLANKVLGEDTFNNVKLRAKALPMLELGAELAKGDPKYTYKVAEAALAAKDGARAERWLNETLRLEPKHSEANLALGEAVLAKGDTARAVKLLSEAARARPNDERLHRVLAEAYGKLGDSKKQEDELSAVVRLSPKDAAAHGTLGKLQFERGARAEALPHLEAAQPAAPDELSILLPLSELVLERGDAKRAAALATRALRRAAQEQRALRVAGLSNHKLQNHKDAAKQLSALTKPDAETQSALGKSKVSLGDLAGAVGPLAAAVAARPNDAALGALYTNTLVRLERFEDATKAGEAAMKAGAKDPSLLAAIGYSYYRAGDPRKSNQLLTQAEAAGAKESYIPLVKGENYYKSKDLKAAKEALTEALRRDPKSGPANFYLGKIAYDENDKKKAVEHLSKTVAEAPGNLEAQEILGRAALGLGDFKTARAALEKVPMKGKAELLTMRGLAQSGTGDPREAEKSYKEALEADPTHYAAIVARGDNYLKLPHWDKAKDLYEQAAKPAPSNPEPVAKLAKLFEDVGEPQEAEKARARVEKIEVKAAEERRKAFKPEEIIQVGIGNFVNNSPTKELNELGVLIPEELTAEFSRIGKIEVLDRVSLAQQLEAANEAAKLDEAVGLEAIDRLQGKIKGMKMAVVGNYLVEGENIRISAKIIDETSRVKKASVQTGPLADRGVVQRKVALELAGEAVPLDEADKRALSRPATTSDLSVAGKLAAAREAELRGDVRGARALYQEALALDADNEDLIKKVKANESRLKERNRLAVGDFRLAGATLTEPWVNELGASIKDQVSTKLAASGAITVVEDPMLHDVFQQEHNLIVQEISSGTADAGSGMVLDVGAMSAKNEAELEKLYAKMKENLKVNVAVSGRYAISGERVSIAAKLHDTEAKQDLLTVTEEGNLKEVIDVENRVAEKLLRALLGTPTDDELAKMRSSQEFKDYQAYLSSLKSKAKPEELAKAPERPKEEPKPEVKPEPPKPEEKKPEVAATEPKPEPEPESEAQEERFHMGYRLKTWLIESDPAANQIEYGPQFMHGLTFGWDHDHARNHFVFSFLKNGSSDPMELGAGNAEYSTLRMWDFAWEGDYKLIGGDPFLNVYVGIQLGLLFLDETPLVPGKNGWTSDEGTKLVLYGDGHLGLALNPFSWITLFGQAGYTYPTSELPIQGVTLTAGAGFRL